MQLGDLTIVVPTRNEAKNIPAFLASLPGAIQLVVVDASEDDTPRLVRVLRPANTLLLRRCGSVTRARQWGAEATDSPWLLFTDADVIFAPDYFDRLQTYDHFDVLYGPKLSTDQFTLYYRWFARAQHLAHRLGVPAASGSNLLTSRRSFFGAGGFDLALTCNEDSEIVWRFKRAGYRVRFAPDLVVYARDHRRLHRGVVRKTFHSIARCTLLYLGLIPERWRHHDWGYWSAPSSDERGEHSG